MRVTGAELALDVVAAFEGGVQAGGGVGHGDKMRVAWESRELY